MSSIYLANDKFFCTMMQGYTVGDTILYVNTVPNNVPTLLVGNKGTANETVLSITGKTSNTLTGVSWLKGESINLLQGTVLYCLNNEEFMNQYKTYIEEPRLDIGLKEIVTPANPSSGYLKVYAKSDDKLYYLDSNGVEKAVGSGGGSVLEVQVFS